MIRMIKINGKDVLGVSIGDTPASAVYVGNRLVWTASTNPELFDINSQWALERACLVASGELGTTGSPRLTFFFPCKPNSTYRISVGTWGDRLGVYSAIADWIEPPSSTPASGNTVHRYGSDVPTNAYYEFTTNSTDNWVWVYFALNSRPTGVSIKKVQ